jgi:hypothetical protein
MKYFVAFVISFFAFSTHAQIALEHSYPHVGHFPGDEFGLVEVDSGIWKYVQVNLADTIAIYNLDHSLDRVIQIPSFNREASSGANVLIIAKHLFELSDQYCFLIFTSIVDSGNTVLIFREDGAKLFSLSKCQFTQNIGAPFGSTFSIIPTASGTKMLIDYPYPGNHQVYSLPGKLPSCSQTLGVNDPAVAFSRTSIPTSAYPNPTTGRVRIAYELPAGVSSGELVLMTVEGKEEKRYHVTNAFNDLLIEVGDLPSGSYFYKLVTEKGESEVRRIELVG